MACKCCEQYAPKHHDGSPLPPCAGTEALEEARNLARLWHRRAIDAGWKSEAQISEEKSREKYTGEKPRETTKHPGPDRHHAIVGSPMGETMVERGCFHCGAFPEIQT